MAISTKSLYEDLLFMLNKNNGEYVSPEEFLRLLIMASDDLYKEYLGRKTVRRAVYGHNSITDARLNVFRVSTDPIPYNKTVRTVDIPEDCRHIRSVIDELGDPLKYQDDNRFYMLSRDSTVNLTKEAYYKEEGTHLEIATKKDIREITIQYLKSPRKPELPYTFVEGDIVFNDSGIVDIEWSEEETANLLNRILIYTGVVLRDNTVVQTGRTQKAEE